MIWYMKHTTHFRIEKHVSIGSRIWDPTTMISTFSIKLQAQSFVMEFDPLYLDKSECCDDKDGI